MGANVAPMALTPETAGALRDALNAVIDQCGDDPQYADLIDALHGAEQAIPDVGHGDHAAHGDHPADDHGAPAEHGAGADEMSADDMFAHAEQQHAAKRKAAKSEAPS